MAAPYRSFRPGAPQPFPWEIDILSDGNLGAHGGSGLSAFGGSIRSGELAPDAPPIAHSIHVRWLSPWCPGAAAAMARANLAPVRPCSCSSLRTTTTLATPTPRATPIPSAPTAGRPLEGGRLARVSRTRPGPPDASVAEQHPPFFTLRPLPGPAATLPPLPTAAIRGTTAQTRTLRPARCWQSRRPTPIASRR